MNKYYIMAWLASLILWTPAFAQNDINLDSTDIELCKQTTAKAVVPKKIDQFKELMSVKCEDKTYLGRPTYSYTFRLTDVDTEKQLRTNFDDYRAKFFNDRCRNQDGTYNRSNYRATYLNKNKQKIADIFVSYFECIGAYDDKITGGLGANEALKQLEKVLKDFQEYRHQAKLFQDDYWKLLSNAKLLLAQFQKLQADAESERIIRAIEALGRMGGDTTSISSPTPSIGLSCHLLRNWISGLNKNCVYNCVGSEATQTIGSAEICPLSIRR